MSDGPNRNDPEKDFLGKPEFKIEENAAPLALAMPFSAINDSYEELFVCAYVVAVWRGPDIRTAIAISHLAETPEPRASPRRSAR